MDLSTILKWLTDNPIIMSVLSALAAPLLAKIPGVLPILNLVAGIVGYKLVPVVAPTPQPITMQTLDEQGNVTGTVQMAGVPQASGPLAGIFEWIKANPLILVAIIGGIIWFVTQKKPTPAPTPTPTPPATTSATPSPELQTLVAPIRTLAAAKPDAARALAGYYAAGADVLRRDATNVATVTQLRDAKIKADALYVQRSPLVGSLPGIGAAVDAVLTQTVGLDDVALDTAKRQRTVEALEAIAWALGA